jgi:outer membrane protein assembly factor BamE (lipoprotein component of BamABCDE complex)
MKRATAWCVTAFLAVAAFGQSSTPTQPTTAREQWEATGDYASLLYLSKQLRRGMPRTEVRELLGEPALEFGDHESYVSDRDEYSPENGVMMHKALAIDYDGEGKAALVTSWEFVLLGE